jgi:hypothetical protein
MRVEADLNLLPGCEVIHRIYEREAPTVHSPPAHDVKPKSAKPVPSSLLRRAMSDRNITAVMLAGLDGLRETKTWYMSVLNLPRTQRPATLGKTVRVRPKHTHHCHFVDSRSRMLLTSIPYAPLLLV